MKINLDLPAEEVQIQIIPLIDVIFCILTFFILASLQLTRPQGINIDLPTATTGATQTREMMVVTITPAGQFLIDQNPQAVDRLQLLQLLQEYHRQKPNGLLVLNASKRAYYDEVAQVLDLMRSVGGDRVALATQPAENNQPLNPAPIPTTSPTIPGLNPLPGTNPGYSSPGLSPVPSMPGQQLPTDLTPGLPGSSSYPGTVPSPGTPYPGTPYPVTPTAPGTAPSR